VDFSRESPFQLLVNLETSVASGRMASGDTFDSIENLIGSDDGIDRFVGNSAANHFRGQGGDYFNGRDGDDLLDGGLAADVLIGGTGEDSLRFSTALGEGNIDRISDFNVADDLILLASDIFDGIGALGALAFGRSAAVRPVPPRMPTTGSFMTATAAFCPMTRMDRVGRLRSDSRGWARILAFRPKISLLSETTRKVARHRVPFCRVVGQSGMAKAMGNTG
jgi:hypothetical protein